MSLVAPASKAPRAHAAVVSRETRPATPAVAPMLDALAPFRRHREIAADDTVVEIVFRGTSGTTIAPPPTVTEDRLALYRALPSAHRLREARATIERALAEPASPAQLAAIIPALLSAAGGSDTTRPEWISATLVLLIDEAHDRRWPVAAMVAGVAKALKTTSFRPTVAEILPHASDALSGMRSTACLCGALLDYRSDLASALYVELAIERDEAEAAGDFGPYVTEPQPSDPEAW